MFKTKYRIVEFENGKFGAEYLIFGFIPSRFFLDLRPSLHGDKFRCRSQSYFYDCLGSSIDEIKSIVDEIETPPERPYKIKAVVLKKYP